jgi:hypothetical protein
MCLFAEPPPNGGRWNNKIHIIHIVLTNKLVYRTHIKLNQKKIEKNVMENNLYIFLNLCLFVCEYGHYFPAPLLTAHFFLFYLHI